MTEKKRGRKPLNDVAETERLEIRLTPELRRRIRTAAAQSDMALGAWVRSILEKQLERDGAT